MYLRGNGSFTDKTEREKAHSGEGEQEGTEKACIAKKRK